MRWTNDAQSDAWLIPDITGMADLQYMPKHIESDATVNLGKALLTMDGV